MSTNMSPRSDGGQMISRKIKVSFVMNSSLVISQIIIGIASRSYITISDSIDGLLDSLSISFPIITSRLSCDHDCTNNREIRKMMTALNLGLMIGFRFLMIINCIIEFISPTSIDINLSNLIIGVLGILINFSVASCLHSHDHNEEDEELLGSVILHVIGDAIGSVLIVIEYILYITESLTIKHIRTFDSSVTLTVSLISVIVSIKLFNDAIISSKTKDLVLR